MESPGRDLSPKRREVESAMSELSLSSSDSESFGEALSQKSTRQLHKLQRKINRVLAARASPSSSESEEEYRSLSSDEENQVEEAIRVKLTKISPHLIMGDEVIGYKMVNMRSDSFDMKPIQVMLRLRIPFAEASI